jgi:hypothetical protein
MPGNFLNSVNPSFKSKKGGRVTGVVAKAKYHTVTENQTQQRQEHSAGHRTSNKVIKVLLDCGSDGDLMFHEKGIPMHFPCLTRHVSMSWHTSNGNFLTKRMSKVNLKFFGYSNSKEYLAGVVEYARRRQLSQCMT